MFCHWAASSLLFEMCTNHPLLFLAACLMCCVYIKKLRWTFSKMWPRLCCFMSSNQSSHFCVVTFADSPPPFCLSYPLCLFHVFTLYTLTASLSPFHLVPSLFLFVCFCYRPSLIEAMPKSVFCVESLMTLSHTHYVLLAYIYRATQAHQFVSFSFGF